MLELLEQLTTHLNRLPPAAEALEAACAGDNVEAELLRLTECTCLKATLNCLCELARERAAIRPDRRVPVEAFLADPDLHALLADFWQKLQLQNTSEEIMACISRHSEVRRTLDARMEQMFEQTLGDDREKLFQ